MNDAQFEYNKITTDTVDKIRQALDMQLYVNKILLQRIQSLEDKINKKNGGNFGEINCN